MPRLHIYLIAVPQYRQKFFERFFDGKFTEARPPTAIDTEIAACEQTDRRIL